MIRFGAMSGLALAISLVLSPASNADPQKLGWMGGPGGGMFDDLCPEDHFLTGIETHSGSYIDRIVGKCRPYGSKRQDPVDQDKPLPARGGTGGTYHPTSCAAGSRVAGLAVGVAVEDGARKYLRHIELICDADPGPYTCASFGRGTCRLEPGDVRFFQHCPTDMVAVGLRGNSGTLIDSLALICDLPPPSQRIDVSKIKNIPAGLVKPKIATKDGPVIDMASGAFKNNPDIVLKEPEAPAAPAPAAPAPPGDAGAGGGGSGGDAPPAGGDAGQADADKSKAEGGGMAEGGKGAEKVMATVVIPDPKLTKLNVRNQPNGKEILTRIPEFSQVSVVGECASPATAGEAAGFAKPKPGDLPSWCQIDSPVEGWVKSDFLQFGAVAASAPEEPAAGFRAPDDETEPAPAEISFGGAWNAETGDGTPYELALKQKGNTVSGSYNGGDGSQGKIAGKIKGNVLSFKWTQADGLSGFGRFKLSEDGQSFEGSYSFSETPKKVEGSWSGSRQ